MARLFNLKSTLAHLFRSREPEPREISNPALELAENFTGHYAFLDEQTNKSHQLIIAPDLTIKIDGRALPGQVIGVTTSALTFLDHYGYQLIISCEDGLPMSVYDEAEDATYQIISPSD